MTTEMNGEPRAILGIWVPVKDADTARYAIKMASMPLFFMGVISLIFGFAHVFHTPNIQAALFFGAVGVSCIPVALLLRAGYLLILIPIVSLFLIASLVFFLSILHFFQSSSLSR